MRLLHKCVDTQSCRSYLEIRFLFIAHCSRFPEVLMFPARTAIWVISFCLLGQGAAPPVFGQGLNNAIRPMVESNASAFKPPVGLARAYQVELTSTWDRPDMVKFCEVTGGETIKGQLIWAGATWIGVLRRETTLMECGVHAAEQCSIRMSGEGEVQASGELVAANGPALELRWSPARGTRVEVEGDCPKAYRDGLARLYRTVTHSALIPIPHVGAEPMEVVLDDQPWKVKVSP